MSVGPASKPRLRCIVPGCNHTRGDRKADPLPADISGWEWLCGDHWKLVPRWMKAIRSRAKRRAVKLNTDAAWAAQHRLWRRCARVAIERALGL